MNSINITGRITHDLELKKLNNDKVKVRYSLAYNPPFNSSKAEFYTCETWGISAENLVKYAGKGSLIGVTGYLRRNIFEGEKGTINETIIVSAHVTFLQTKPPNSEVIPAWYSSKNDKEKPTTKMLQQAIDDDIKEINDVNKKDNKTKYITTIKSDDLPW